MVALVTRGVDDVPLAIHRTFLARDGSGKAPVDPQKMMLGPCRGGAVRLAPAGDVLMVGEGIETCLAAMQARGHPAWAALSTSGLLALDLPDDVRDVIVLADGDEAGKAAARGAALRWKREGRRVRIAHPPQGLDFNDMLLGRAPKSRGARNERRSSIASIPKRLSPLLSMRLKKFSDPLDGLVERTATDPGAPFEPDVLERLAALQKSDRAAFETLRAQLKAAGCRVTALDEALAGENGDTGGRRTQAGRRLDQLGGRG